MKKMKYYQYTLYTITFLLIILNNCDQTNAYIQFVKEGDFNSLSEVFNHILNQKKGQVSNQNLQSYNTHKNELTTLNRIVSEDRPHDNFENQIAVVVFANDNSRENLKNTNRFSSLTGTNQNFDEDLEKVVKVVRTIDDESAGSGEKNLANPERSDEQEQSTEDCLSSELVNTDEEIQPGEDRTEKNVQRFGFPLKCRCRKCTRKCIVACQDTYRTVCQRYNCSKGTKYMFKKRCIRNCKIRMK